MKLKRRNKCLSLVLSFAMLFSFTMGIFGDMNLKVSAEEETTMYSFTAHVYGQGYQESDVIQEETANTSILGMPYDTFLGNYNVSANGYEAVNFGKLTWYNDSSCINKIDIKKTQVGSNGSVTYKNIYARANPLKFDLKFESPVDDATITVYKGTNADGTKKAIDSVEVTYDTLYKNALDGITIDINYDGKPNPYSWDGSSWNVHGASSDQTILSETYVKISNDAYTLQPIFNEKKYIILDSQDGSNTTVVDLNEDEDGNTTLKQDLPALTRTGYTFLGWFDAPTGGNQVEGKAGDHIDSRTTLYAHWEGMEVTMAVYSNVNSSDRHSEYRYVLYGQTYSQSTNDDGSVVGLPDAAYMQNTYDSSRIFVGWNTEKDGSGVNVTNTMTVENIDGIDLTSGFIRLYAQWREPEVQALIDALNSIDKDTDIFDTKQRSGDTYDLQCRLLQLYSALSDEQKTCLNYSINSIMSQLITALKVKHHTAPNGMFIDTPLLDANVKLISDRLSLDSETAQKIKQLLNDKEIYNLWDISLIDILRNADYDLNGESIKIKIPAELIEVDGVKNPSIVHLKANGELEKLSLTKEGDYYAIEMSSFSPIALVDDTNNVDGTNTSGGNVKTGDSTPIFVLAAFMLSAYASIAFVISRKRKLG